MKVGIITKPNDKGQIVIPKEIRDFLMINPNDPLNLMVRGGGIYIYPVDEVVTKNESESSYLNVLQKTQGRWDKENWTALRKKREKIETDASKRRRKSW